MSLEQAKGTIYDHKSESREDSFDNDFSGPRVGLRESRSSLVLEDENFAASEDSLDKKDDTKDIQDTYIVENKDKNGLDNVNNSKTKENVKKVGSKTNKHKNKRKKSKTKHHKKDKRHKRKSSRAHRKHKSKRKSTKGTSSNDFKGKDKSKKSKSKESNKTKKNETDSKNTNSGNSNTNKNNDNNNNDNNEKKSNEKIQKMKDKMREKIDIEKKQQPRDSAKFMKPLALEIKHTDSIHQSDIENENENEEDSVKTVQRKETPSLPKMESLSVSVTQPVRHQISIDSTTFSKTHSIHELTSNYSTISQSFLRDIKTPPPTSVNRGFSISRTNSRYLSTDDEYAQSSPVSPHMITRSNTAGTSIMSIIGKGNGGTRSVTTPQSSMTHLSPNHRNLTPNKFQGLSKQVTFSQSINEYDSGAESFYDSDAIDEDTEYDNMPPKRAQTVRFNRKNTRKTASHAVISFNPNDYSSDTNNNIRNNGKNRRNMKTKSGGSDAIMRTKTAPLNDNNNKMSANSDNEHVAVRVLKDKDELYFDEFEIPVDKFLNAYKNNSFQVLTEKEQYSQYQQATRIARSVSMVNLAEVLDMDDLHVRSEVSDDDSSDSSDSSDGGTRRRRRRRRRGRGSRGRTRNKRKKKPKRKRKSKLPTITNTHSNNNSDIVNNIRHNQKKNGKNNKKKKTKYGHKKFSEGSNAKKHNSTNTSDSLSETASQSSDMTFEQIASSKLMHNPSSLQMAPMQVPFRKRSQSQNTNGPNENGNEIGGRVRSARGASHSESRRFNDFATSRARNNSSNSNQGRYHSNGNNGNNGNGNGNGNDNGEKNTTHSSENNNSNDSYESMSDEIERMPRKRIPSLNTKAGTIRNENAMFSPKTPVINEETEEGMMYNDGILNDFDLDFHANDDADATDEKSGDNIDKICVTGLAMDVNYSSVQVNDTPVSESGSDMKAVARLVQFASNLENENRSSNENNNNNNNNNNNGNENNNSNENENENKNGVTMNVSKEIIMGRESASSVSSSQSESGSHSRSRTHSRSSHTGTYTRSCSHSPSERSQTQTSQSGSTNSQSHSQSQSQSQTQSSTWNTTSESDDDEEDEDDSDEEDETSASQSQNNDKDGDGSKNSPENTDSKDNNNNNNNSNSHGNKKKKKNSVVVHTSVKITDCDNDSDNDKENNKSKNNKNGKSSNSNMNNHKSNKNNAEKNCGKDTIDVATDTMTHSIQITLLEHALMNNESSNTANTDENGADKEGASPRNSQILAQQKQYSHHSLTDAAYTSDGEREGDGHSTDHEYESKQSFHGQISLSPRNSANSRELSVSRSRSGLQLNRRHSAASIEGTPPANSTTHPAMINNTSTNTNGEVTAVVLSQTNGDSNQKIVKSQTIDIVSNHSNSKSHSKKNNKRKRKHRKKKDKDKEKEKDKIKDKNKNKNKNKNKTKSKDKDKTMLTDINTARASKSLSLSMSKSNSNSNTPDTANRGHTPSKSSLWKKLGFGKKKEQTT